ncbi:MAG: hypothetical protein AAGH64_10470 [Planctomycetota bacterium]
MTKTTACTAALIATACFSSGCEFGTFFGLGASTTALTAFGGSSVVASYGMGAAYRHGHHGPRVTVRNETDRAIALRVWMGKIDVRDPDGYSDMRTDEDLALVLEPGTNAVRRPDKRAWATARTDAVVWVQWSDVSGDVPAQWIAFDRPAPFELVLVEGEDGVVVDGARSTPHGPVPAGRRIIGRVGEHPVWDSADASN